MMADIARLISFPHQMPSEGHCTRSGAGGRGPSEGGEQMVDQMARVFLELLC